MEQHRRQDLVAGHCAGLGGFLAFNLSLLKPEELRDFLFYVCAVTWGEGVLEGQFSSEHHPSGAALRMTVGAGTHLGGV